MTRGIGGEVQPGLGMSWSHVPRTRILLERVEGAAAHASCSGLRSAVLIKSSRQVIRSMLLIAELIQAGAANVTPRL